MPEHVPGSPHWWVDRLSSKLTRRASDIETFDRYYTGDHPLPFIPDKLRNKLRGPFHELQRQSQSNFMPLVVEATEERLRVEGFRLSAESDETTDEESWRIWQANQMDAESQTAIIEALVKGVSYLSVWGNGETASIAVEDPTQTVVEYESGSSFQRRLAALKVWTDDLTGEELSTLYLPDGLYKFRRGQEWTERENGDEPWPLPNPVGVVPIVPLRNRPRLLEEGESELDVATTSQDRINGVLYHRMLASWYSAVRQKWASGVEKQTDPNTGKEVDPFDPVLGLTFLSKAPDARFGTFDSTDLDNFIKQIEQDVLHIAVQTRTPRHYLVQQGQSPSGDAIKSAEAGLVAKVRRKMRHFGEGFEETMRLARQFAGEPEPPTDSEVVWADPEFQTVAQVTDAVVKQFEAGLIPASVALEKLGYTQTEIRRITGQRAAELLRMRAAEVASDEEIEEAEAVAV